MHDPVTWYGINYAETQVTQWDVLNKRTRTSLGRRFFVLKVPLCNLRPSLASFVPFYRLLQRAHFHSVGDGLRSDLIFVFCCTRDREVRHKERPMICKEKHRDHFNQN